MTKICYIMAGVSGSGKSTVVKKLLELEQTKNVEVFSLDTCRLDFFDQITDDPKRAYADAFKYANENQQRFNAFVTATWNYALQADVVIVDNMNGSVKARARWINEARAKGFSIIGVQVYCPLQVALDRQASRADKTVPAEVVRDAYFRHQEMILGSEVDFLLIADGEDSSTLIGALSLR